MASIEVSVFQEARNRIDRDISSIIQLLNEKKNTLFGDITDLEDEFKSKQQQNLNSLKKLESLKAHTEELGNNHLSEIQARLTQELQSEIDKINQEMKSLTVEYRIEINWDWSWRNGIQGMREKIKELSIVIIPKESIYVGNILFSTGYMTSRRNGYSCGDWEDQSYDDLDY